MRRIAVMLMVVSSTGAAACKRTPAPVSVDAPPPDAGPRREVVRIQQISVEAAAWPEAAGPPLDDRLLAGRVWEGLAQSADFEAVGRRGLPDGGAAVHRRRARIRTVYGVEGVPGAAKAPPVLRGTATLTIEWSDDLEGPELWSAVACDGELPKDRHRLAAAASALVECAIERAAHDLIEKERLRHADLPAVLAALDNPEPELRQVAYAAIGDRHLVGALPRLVELLGSPDELVRDGAIGALVALRDRRAVKPLTQLAEFKDLDLMRRIIDAVGAIGGDEAHDYLELVATGHEVPIIRELAQQALGRMDRRADAGL
jgi:HEAT repeats